MSSESFPVDVGGKRCRAHEVSGVRVCGEARDDSVDVGSAVGFPGGDVGVCAWVELVGGRVGSSGGGFDTGPPHQARVAVAAVAVRRVSSPGSLGCEQDTVAAMPPGWVTAARVMSPLVQ